MSTKGTVSESTKDPTGDKSDLRAIIDQQGEKIGQLTYIVELQVKQLLGMNLLMFKFKQLGHGPTVKISQVCEQIEPMISV